MKAKEMFKDLGYECRLAYQHICYVKHGNDGHIISMIFDLDKKTFCSGHGLALRDIGIDEFLAVQKQMEELGWIEKETKCKQKNYLKN